MITKTIDLKKMINSNENVKTITDKLRALIESLKKMEQNKKL